NDIIQVASIIQGRGVFQNVPATRRQGLEAGAQYQAPPWLFYINYALVDATYQFAGKVASPNNPSADADGNVFVTPGNHIPGIPLHQIKTGVDYAVTTALKLGTDMIWVSSQWYIGDQANQNVKLADYWLANLHGSYQLTDEVRFRQKSIQSEIRDLWYLFQPAGDCQRTSRPADRSPYGHASAAALGLYRSAWEADRECH